MVSSFCLKEKLIVYITYIEDINAYCDVCVCECSINKSAWSMELRVMILWWKKLGRSNVVNVEGVRCWTCLGEIVLLVMDALLIGKNGRVITQKRLVSCHGNMVKNIRKKRT